MTLKSTYSELSYKLTESILSAPASQPSTITRQNNHYHYPTSDTSKMITDLPLNSVVIHPKEDDSAFNEYIGHHFKEDAPVLLNRLSVATPVIAPQYTSNKRKEHNDTLWAYLSTDLESKPRKPVVIRDNNPWHEYDAVFQDSRPPPCYESLRQSPSSLSSLGALLFLFGFVCPPFWWVGSFYPFEANTSLAMAEKNKTVELKTMEKWRTLNRFFSLGFSTLLIAAIVILIALHENFYS